MDFDTIYAALPERGWLSRDEALLLFETAAATTGPMLEIGCFHGRSTCLLASFSRPMNCVDPFVGGIVDDDPTGEVAYQAFMANLTAWGRPPHVVGSQDRRCATVAPSRLLLFPQPAESWWPRPCGFAYLDGDHSYEGTREQVLKALFCFPSAIAAHDVTDEGFGADVTRACVELLGDPTARASRMAVWRR